MKISSDATWMNVASSGLRRPHAGHANSDRIDDQSSIEVLIDNGPPVSRDPHRFYEFEQIIADEDYVGAFARKVCPRSHRYADSSFAQRGCIIDAVPRP
jgi:hypothetical protein